MQRNPNLSRRKGIFIAFAVIIGLVLSVQLWSRIDSETSKTTTSSDLVQKKDQLQLQEDMIDQKEKQIEDEINQLQQLRKELSGLKGQLEQKLGKDKQSGSTTGPTEQRQEESKPDTVGVSGLSFPLATKQYKLAIGIPSVKRTGTQYVVQAIDDLINRIPVDDLRETKIVLFNANKPPQEHPSIHEIGSKYPDLLDAGILEMVTIGLHPEMADPNKLKKNYGDSLERIIWRSNEILDFIYVIKYTQQYSENILFLEDDVTPAWNYHSLIMDWLKHTRASKSDWIFAALYAQDRLPNSQDAIEYKFWCCTQAILFKRGESLTNLIDYAYPLFDDKPIDWIMKDWLEAHPAVHALIKVPNLFQHTGHYSSLKEKQNLFMHSSPTFVPDPSNAEMAIVEDNYNKNKPIQ